MPRTQAAQNPSLLLQILEQGYDRPAWHGPNLRQALRGVSGKIAARRPASGRHNIWEIAVHAAYWKYVVRRRLRGEKRGSFALKGSNWFPRPIELSEKAWRADLALLEEEHCKLRETVADCLAAHIEPLPERLIFGAAFHDVYHAGQIQVIKGMWKRARGR